MLFMAFDSIDFFSFHPANGYNSFLFFSSTIIYFTWAIDDVTFMNQIKLEKWKEKGEREEERKHIVSAPFAKNTTVFNLDSLPICIR